MASDLLRELAPLLSEDGIDVNNIDSLRPSTALRRIWRRRRQRKPRRKESAHEYRFGHHLAQSPSGAR
jgi:hypothetical protein